MSEDILCIENLGLDFKVKTEANVVLDNLNLVQKKGEWLALIGQSGAGKTSLGMIIKGLINPTRGRIRMYSDSTEEDLGERKSKIGFLFSNPRDQICSLTVQGDIAFGLFHLGLSRKEIKKRTEEALNILGISHLANRSTHSISGGEQQKVALAGLIALKPEYIILDEPATFLSPNERDELLHILKDLHSSGINILYISSSWEEIFIADKVAVLHKGRIYYIESPDRLLQDEEILKLTGHCTPEIYKLIKELKKHGLSLSEHEQDIDQVLNSLIKILKGKRE
ncbi:MAG: energy-coupling factor ABC transporter ATP-binding protein [bacterium]